MKKSILILFTFVSLLSYSQVPQGISYQSIVRNASGDVMTNALVGIRISIIQGSVNGQIVYSERHAISTNPNGVFSIIIGKGTSLDKFSSINWSLGPYFIKTEIDTNGGEDYNIVGTSQILSVPYAQYAGGLTLKSPQGKSFNFTTDEMGNLIAKNITPPQSPEVNTSSAENVLSTSADAKGTITYTGNSSIISKGIEYSTQRNFINGSGTKITASTSSMNFNIHLENLIDGTTYYFKAFAENSIGLSYGVELSFTTKSISPPQIETLSPRASNSSKAILQGAIRDDGNAMSNELGIEYSLTKDFGEGSGKQVVATLIEGDIFEIQISNLEKGKTYYFKSFGRNIKGTSYGSQFSFNTTDDLIDIDGNTYKTAIIGSQQWMTQNLATTKYSDGTPILLATDTTYVEWNNQFKAYRFPNDNANGEKDKYGAYYTFGAAVNGTPYNGTQDVQGACPDGWHVPSDNEWKELERFLGMQESEIQKESWRGTNQAGLIKSTTSWADNGNGTDNYFFSAVASGFSETINESAYDLGNSCYLWASDEEDNSDAYRRVLFSYMGSIHRYYSPKARGFSLRCIKD